MDAREARELRVGRLLGRMPGMTDAEQRAAYAALSDEDKIVYRQAVRAAAAEHFGLQQEPAPPVSQRAAQRARTAPRRHTDRSHGWRWTAFVNGFWKAVGWAVVLLIVAFILLAHSGSPSGAHAPAYEQQQARLAQENRALAFQEEERQREYAAHAGPPYPTKGWTP